MTKQATFRLTKLALAASALGMAFNANAIFNLYNKDGLSLDINGQIDIQATKNDRTHTLLQDGADLVYTQAGTLQFANTSKAGAVIDSTDKETRLNQNQGVSFIDFRGSQKLPNDWRVTGNVGTGYSDDRNLYLSNSSLSLDKKGIGAITLGRQYLHTNYVGRTGTDTPLDIFSTSALRLDYYGIKGLHASAYYSLAGSNDVRKENNTELESGYGASLSYRFPFSDKQYVRFGAGYTQSDFNPVTTGNAWFSNQNTLNRYPQEAQGVAGSLEYKYDRFLIAADVGQKKETMSKSEKTPLDTRKTDYLGGKVSFDINPIFQVSAGYGVKKAKTTLKAGATPLTNNINSIFLGHSAFHPSFVGLQEMYLFDKADTKEFYVQADYRIRPNVRLYGRYDEENTTYKVGGTDFSKVEDRNARAGLVFSF